MFYTNVECADALHSSPSETMEMHGDVFIQLIAEPDPT